MKILIFALSYLPLFALCMDIEYRLTPDGAELIRPTEAELRSKATHYLKMLVASGANDKLLKDKSGRRVSLRRLITKMNDIKFVIRFSMFLERSPRHVDRCVDIMRARWLTANDTSMGKPIVAFMLGSNTSGSEIESIFFHEALSAIGIVDDSYEITGPLVSIVKYMEKMDIQRFEDIPDNFLNSMSMTELKKVRWRKHAPRFTLNSNYNCYDRNGRLLESLSGGITGIGGGGDTASMMLKTELQKYSSSWIDEKARELDLSEKQRRALFNSVSRIGIEPGEMSITCWRPEIKISRSHITGKETVYMWADGLLRSRQCRESNFNALLEKLLARVM